MRFPSGKHGDLVTKEQGMWLVPIVPGSLVPNLNLIRCKTKELLRLHWLPLTLFSKGYFIYTTVWGEGGIVIPPLNFVVSSSIMIKFGVLIEFDKFSPK